MSKPDLEKWLHERYPLKPGGGRCSPAIRIAVGEFFPLVEAAREAADAYWHSESADAEIDAMIQALRDLGVEP